MLGHWRMVVACACSKCVWSQCLTVLANTKIEDQSKQTLKILLVIRLCSLWNKRRWKPTTYFVENSESEKYHLLSIYNSTHLLVVMTESRKATPCNWHIDLLLHHVHYRKRMIIHLTRINSRSFYRYQAHARIFISINEIFQNVIINKWPEPLRRIQSGHILLQLIYLFDGKQHIQDFASFMGYR
jgi:hypothetical protein